MPKQIYEFNPTDAVNFAIFVHSKYHYVGKELTFEFCPYCKPQHDRNTFSINCQTGLFQCKRASCGAKGNMLTLSRDFGFSLSEEVDRYLEQNNYKNRYRVFDSNMFSKIVVREEAVKYLNSRGISKEVVEKYKITTNENNSTIICFPFFDTENQLQFVKYRNTEYMKGFTPGSKEWCEKNCKPILYGMNLVDTETKELVITEGQIDSLSVVESGYNNAVSVPTGCNGFTWLPYCWEWLQKFETIIIFGDCENGVVTLYDYLHTRLGKKVKCVQIEDYQGYKDANEILLNCGSQYVIQAIDNARKQVSAKLKTMSSVKSVDLSKIPHMSTGIAEIDRFLDGGFREGQVILQTGERGNGKSTVASGFIPEALMQGWNCFIYSGELPDFYVKNWLDRQITGKREPTQSEIDSVNKWYEDRLFIYDNEIDTEGNEQDELLSIIEESIVMKDCKFLLLDNLMTIVSENDDESLYRKQSSFVGQLCKIAKKYKVVIMLIAHPRKKVGSMNGNFCNDDVSGSGDITNRVDIVMSYDRIYEKGVENDPSARQMSITKNRLTGKTTTANTKVQMFYNDDSKRVSDYHKDFNRVYIDNGFVEPEEDLILPF